MKRTAGTDFPTDCLGTTDGNIHIAVSNFKSVRVRPFAKVACGTLCNPVTQNAASLLRQTGRAMPEADYKRKGVIYNQEGATDDIKGSTGSTEQQSAPSLCLTRIAVDDATVSQCRNLSSIRH
ncbi:hypothetical protein [Bacteroides caecimuris]|uniref:hypothetical protein n=1 Tax=Bacteroides caecimuris TaxID=1796613 RepID=UPI0026EBF040|nr:hypothetical protein [Bacteroides caecimuris]